MKEEMTLKEFMEIAMKQSPMMVMTTARDLITLEGIEQTLNLMWGVELDIKVKPAEKREGRFFGKSLIEALDKKDN